jgi:hypothetical protein
LGRRGQAEGSLGGILGGLLLLQVADRQEVVGDIEVAQVHGDIDRAKAQAVASIDIPAGSYGGLGRAQVLAADGIEKLLGGGRRGAGRLLRGNRQGRRHQHSQKHSRRNTHGLDLSNPRLPPGETEVNMVGGGPQRMIAGRVVNCDCCPFCRP